MSEKLSPRLLLAIAATLICQPFAFCQDSGDDAQGDSLPQANNPLSGLFTPQPQYPTAQSKMNPTPSNVSDNPLGGLFTAQPQYPTAETKMNPLPMAPDAATPGSNPLSGLYTGQPQFVTPETHLNVDAKPLQQWVSPTMEKQSADKAAKDKEEAEAKAKAEADAKAKTDADAKAKADADAKAKADKEKSSKEKKKSKSKGKDKDKDEPEAKPLVYNPLQDTIFLVNAGRYGEALTAVSGILKQNPSDAKAHYIAGVIQVGLRNYQAAAAEYGTVLKLVPTTPLAQRAADGLRKIGMPPPVPPSLPPLRVNK